MLANAILITGASQRLGFELAKALHTDNTPVIVSYRTERESIKELRSLGIFCIQADFSNNGAIEVFANQIHAKCSSLKAIIHNASDWLAESDEIKPSDIMNTMLQIHVQTPYQLNLSLEKLLLTYAQQNKIAADIIHFTDYIVDKGSKKHIAYAASKAGLANLTLSFSAKLAPQVKVNSIAPSLLMFNENDSAAYQQKTLKKSLMQIAPGAIEGIEAVRYLLKSRYITGHTLHLNGGRALV
ncbi:dihydromonapterin reductase [Thalassomonas sp. M1454]|uniref:dihydromonapterin reductase n=1 Tax=Thalassomonas sp. M1454 TaxID=2594477 RepID=UPI00117EC04C|nr:dihydromonapterin reductase [Thalassomonas sp. M1454]TRX53854.1 dihydromonapterin reductase [Thalassomonas sp. M1454]